MKSSPLNKSQFKQLADKKLNIDVEQVSEETSREMSEYSKQVETQEKLDWQYFDKSKKEIQNLMKQLIPQYCQYRKVLFDSVKDICQQGNLKRYDYASLACDTDQIINKIHDFQYIQDAGFDVKKTVVQKIIGERRIKRYYKTKHEINYQDQLDPQNDQEQIYRFYEEAFGANPSNPLANLQNNLNVQQHYNEQYRNPVQRLNTQRSGKPQYPQSDFDESFERMKYQNEHITKKNINYLKKNELFPFDNQLSFDVKNEGHFVNPTFVDSFGFNDDEKNSVNSQINFDAEKMKRFLRNNNKSQQKKQDDQLSHADNIYKNFIERQNEELSKQKKRVQELTEKAERVLNNDIEEDEPKEEIKSDITAQLRQKIQYIRYLLGEMVEIFTVGQCLKFQLKFKSFELMNKLYQNASIYYKQQILFEEPVQAKYLSQIIRAALPQEGQNGINVILHNIFYKSEQISYDLFHQRLTPLINQKQYQLLQNNVYTVHSNKTFDLTIRLFNIWIEVEYFQKRLKEFFEKNIEMVDGFIEQVTQNASLVPQIIADFINKNKKATKIKKLKTEIYFRHILGQKLSASEFYRWIESRSEIVKEESQYQQGQGQFYYHLY